MVCSTPAVFGQAVACPSISAPVSATAADTAYGEAGYADAERLYGTAFTQHPKDLALGAALVRTLLRDGKVSEASIQANRTVSYDPRSAIALTALAEVQLQQGLPWLAKESVDAALASDPCDARSHLVRSSVLRLESTYASERSEIQRAYEIDPADPDIHRAWEEIVSPANEITTIDRSRTAANLDVKDRQTVDTSIHSLMSRLSEDSETCRILPTVASATLPLLASIEEKRQHVYRYQLEAQLSQSTAKLLVDSAASGLYISRALAEQNNLHQGAGAPKSTVHVDSIRIGPLEFRDCTVGVSDPPFPDHSDGIIGTDIFAPYLVTLDFRSKRLSLDALPAQATLLPGDRSTAPGLKGFFPVYRRKHYLLLPVTLDSKSRKLFVIGTGMPYSAMTSEAAQSVSKVKVNFTNAELTASGIKEEFYRDTFDLQFANLRPIQHRRIAEFDLSTIDQNAGFEVAGIVGLDILHSMALHLDYRDGLVKFDLLDQELAAPKSNGTSFSLDVGNPNQ